MSPALRRSLLSLTLIICCFLLLLLAARTPASASTPLPAVACGGSIARCQAAVEFMMDSEINRRMLQGDGHIGYRGLGANRPVCDVGRGRPYVNNCVPPPSNPYRRPCNTYYQCRDGSIPSI